MTGHTGGELIADYLVRATVPYVVGLCGHGNIGLLDALRARRDEIGVISVHHEAAAGFIADAYYRVRRQPLATLTSCGPGSAQLLVALGAALMDSSAMLAITGNVPATQFGRAPFQELGRHHQADFPGAARPYVKRSFQATRADQLPVMLPQAFGSMLAGRPGPVNLDVPLNVFAEPAPEPGAVRGPVRPPRSAADPEDIRSTLDLLRGAERPVIVVGAGAADGTGRPEEVTVLAGDIAAFADAAGIPVISSPAGKDLASGCGLYLGPAGRNGTLAANRAARNADVILALGTRFDDRSASSWLDGYTYAIPPTKLIQVHGDPAEVGRNYPAELGIAATVSAVVRQLLETDPGDAPDARKQWLERTRDWREEWEQHTAPGRADDRAGPGGMHPARVLAELRGVLPENAIVLADVGAHHNWIVQEWKPGGPGTLLQSWGFAAMGFGVAGALGARLAAPARPVVSVVGDGGFLMMPGVIATAVEYGLPAVWIVWNNGGYISIRDQQRGYFGPEIATSFTHHDTGDRYRCDFAGMARSMGADGLSVTTPRELGETLQAAVSTGRPTVIDVPVDAEIPQPAVATWDLPPLPHPEPGYGWPDA